MVWFLRVIEQPDGSWTCRRGRADIDSHQALPLAIEHLITLAAGIDGDSALFVHRLNGTVERHGQI